MLYFNLLLGFGSTSVVLLVTAVVVALDVWGFGLVYFLEHAPGLLGLFKFLLVPDNSLAVAETVFLILHLLILPIKRYF